MTVADVIDDEDLVRRAFAAWFRNGRKLGIPIAQPSNASSVEERDGKFYVVLVSGRSTLAVYRVRTDGVLKGMRRPPKDLAPDWYE